MKSFSKLAASALSVILMRSDIASASFGQKATIGFDRSNGSLLLATSSSPVNLILDGADWPGVLRVANDLAIDFGRVTGVNGSLTAVGNGTKSAANIFNVTGINRDWSITSKKGSSGEGGGTVIAGTIGNSSLIDALVKSGKIDVSAIEGQWEAFVSTVVKNPTNGTTEALVIAGKTECLKKS